MDGRLRTGDVIGEDQERGLAAVLETAQANTMLQHGGYGVWLEHSGWQWQLNGPGTGIGVPLGTEPTWANLFHALVRLRRTRQRWDWLSLLYLEHWLGNSWKPQRARNWESLLTEFRDWRRLSRAVESDHLLRMCCAIQPPILAEARIPEARIPEVPAGWSVNGDAGLSGNHFSGSALFPTPRYAAPAPRHPKYPCGTVSASIPALVRTPLLGHVIENRFERRENACSYFQEMIIRPLLRTFRLTLDSHHIGICSWDDVGLELSPEMHATGRVVVGNHRNVHAINAPRNEMRTGMNALLGTLDALAKAFSSSAPEAYPLSQVRAAIERVTAEELRYLKPHSVEVLSTGETLRRFAHSVSADQDRILNRVQHSVQEQTRKRRWDRTVPRPAVVIDLDLCGIVPARRTFASARAVSGPRSGAPNGIPEFASPSDLPILPSFVESTWRDFVERSGLRRKYPLVDWQQVYQEFFRAFARPWKNLRTDQVNPGLARFVWDIRDAGGRVIFCTGRRERVREHTEEVLVAGGIPNPELLCMPDDRTRPIAELKVESLRKLSDIDVIAVFDDTLANRIALTKEFSTALAVAVEVPGYVNERHPGQPAPDGVPVISTFETVPAVRAATGPALSHAHSLEEIQLGALRHHRQAHQWSVKLTQEDSLAIVDSIVADTDRAAERTGRSARARFVQDDRAEAAYQESIIRALHHIFTRKQFLKGSRSNYSVSDMTRDAMPSVRCGQPIDVVLLGFPIKQCLNRLKALGPLPDLAELGSLMRLRELDQVVRAVYPPGLHFNILTDGRHFRPRPASITAAYSHKLREYLALAGIEANTTIEDLDVIARTRFGSELIHERPVWLRHYQAVLGEALNAFDITDNPLSTLADIAEYASQVNPPVASNVAESLGLFPEILMSLVYSVPLPVPGRTDRLKWSSTVYADIYNLTDASVSAEVRQARTAVLKTAWHTVIRYLATLCVDEKLGYEELFPNRIRLTISAAQRGRCGFSYLGGSGLLPWQGTGVMDQRGRVAADFAISLLDQGFVPAYSPLIGPRQPWMMLPSGYACRTESESRTGSEGMRVDPSVFTTIRLRRK